MATLLKQTKAGDDKLNFPQNCHDYNVTSFNFEQKIQSQVAPCRAAARRVLLTRHYRLCEPRGAVTLYLLLLYI